MSIIRKRKKRGFSTTQIIAYGFLISMIVGMLLLMLPVSSKEGTFTSPIDALFTATTSVCVTGLTTLPVGTHFSVFGQLVILFLIQIGGLGVVTFTTLVMLFFAQRITLKERLLIRDAYNLNSLNGIIRLTKKIVIGTLICELFGAVLYSFVFVRDFGLIGIYYAIFNSVSAFCNAGIDLLGTTSLAVYRDNIIANVVTMVLIVLGGLGFPVWWDVIKCFRQKSKKCDKGLWHSFNLHTKLVLSVTIILIVGGSLLIFLLEYNNPKTIGDLSLPCKIQASFFQSVTTRTAGFFTIPQENFTDASAFVSLVLMFIGGSPSGTAGGVKTVTIAMIILTVIAIVKNRTDTEVFGRSISEQTVRKGIAVFAVSFSILMISMALLSITQGSDFLDSLYEVVSALATVGLTRGLTGELDAVGKLIIIITMYIGRIGPISLALFFNANNSDSNLRRFPKGDIHVG